MKEYVVEYTKAVILEADNLKDAEEEFYTCFGNERLGIAQHSLKIKVNR
jgi:hypothetical protein